MKQWAICTGKQTVLHLGYQLAVIPAPGASLESLYKRLVADDPVWAAGKPCVRWLDVPAHAQNFGSSGAQSWLIFRSANQ